MTNNDLSAGTVNEYGDNISGLSMGAIGASPGQVTDACTIFSIGGTVSFNATISVTNKSTSNNSNTVQLQLSATPTTAEGTRSTTQVQFNITSTVAGNVYYAIRSSSDSGTIVVDKRTTATAISAGGTVYATYVTGTAVEYYLTDVYFVESGKLRSATAVNRMQKLNAAAPHTYPDGSTSDYVDFGIMNQDDAAGTMYYTIVDRD